VASGLTVSISKTTWHKVVTAFFYWIRFHIVSNLNKRHVHILVYLMPFIVFKNIKEEHEI
jgi:hypothetical protein